MEEWSAQANKDGYLDWESFSLGLAKALQTDASRLRKMADVPPTEAVRMMQASKRRGSLLEKGVESREIEEFLCRCEVGKLVQALALARKEVYRCQMQLPTEREDRSSAGKEVWSGRELHAGTV